MTVKEPVKKFRAIHIPFICITSLKNIENDFLISKTT